VPRRWLLTQNSELRKDGVFNWTLPAWAIRLQDGRTVNVCPQAGICADLCYARTGTYRFSNVRAAHERNLTMVLDDLPGWETAMTAELEHRRYGGRHIRIHDSGDFFSDDYLKAWLRIIRSAPGVQFYCYTKEVTRFRRMVETDPPGNFRWVFSLGGREDHLVDRDRDRHAEVFPDEAAVTAAGYSSQDASDLLAVYGPPKVGIPANNIPHLRKRLGQDTFGGRQESRDSDRAARRQRNLGR
jgi:hypothetical protein